MEQFLKVILPWQATVAERFKDCEGDDRCKAALDLARKGDLPGADVLLTRAIEPRAPAAALTGKEAKRIAEALYDRAVIRAHQQRYAEAVADLQRAIALQPKRAKWPAELASVEQMARDKEALRAQGLP